MEAHLHGMALVAVLVVSMVICRKYGQWSLPVFPAFVCVLAAVAAIIQRLLIVRDTDPGFFFTLLTHQGLFLAACLGLLLYYLPLTRTRKLWIIACVLVLAIGAGMHLHRLLSLPWYSVDVIPARVTARCTLPIEMHNWHTWLTGVEGQAYPDWYPISPKMMPALVIYEENGEGFQYVSDPPKPYEFGLAVADSISEKLYTWIVPQNIPLQANLQAIVLLSLIACMAITGLLTMYRWWKGRREYWRLAFFTGLCVLLSVTTLLFPYTHRNHVLGTNSVLLITCSALLVSMLSSRLWVQLGILMLMILVSTWLVSQDVLLYCSAPGNGVYQVNYPSHREPFSREEILAGARDELAKAVKADQRSYPAGWLKDSPVWETNILFGRYYSRWIDPAPVTAWHTWLTGLRYSRNYILWYPGGPLKEGLAKLEFREYTPPYGQSVSLRGLAL